MIRSISYSIILVVGLFSIVAFASGKYPLGPDPKLTPGALCKYPDNHRYESRMPYCERNVWTKDKWAIINAYMKKYNFVIDQTNRDHFKIDHYIPLCMGGSNELTNLWPQHESIYHQTDLLEALLCEKLADGKITQAQAIAKIKTGKLNLQLIPVLIKQTNEIK